MQAANSAYNSTGQDKLVYLQTDHLGTPRLATDAAKRTVWQHKYLHNFLGLFDNLGMSLKNTLATLMNVYRPVTVVWSWNT